MGFIPGFSEPDLGFGVRGFNCESVVFRVEGLGFKVLVGFHVNP